MKIVWQIVRELIPDGLKCEEQVDGKQVFFLWLPLSGTKWILDSLESRYREQLSFLAI